MGYVVPEKPDIFLSYAWVDNDELPDGSPGWVSEFALWLLYRLGQKIGRRDVCHLWMDSQLPSNARLSPEIEAKVRDSAVMIVVLSEGYLASDWCKKELGQFLEKEIERRCDSGSRIFVVEMSNVTRPPALAKHEVLGTRFWVMEPLSQRVRVLGFAKAERGDSEYINQIIDLSDDIAKELKRQKAAVAAAQPKPEPEHERAASAPPSNGVVPPISLPAVYLAEVSDDLEDLRDEVKRYLDQAGYQVRPANRLPENIDGFEDAVRAELDRSVVFVQLLSAVAGRKFDGLDRRRVAAQHDLVAGRSMPVLLWRRRTSLDLERSPDFSFDVFLSHNSKDKARVKALAERLRAVGLRVWFDDWIIRPGDDIYLAVERGLETARTLVLCLSPAAVGSDWTGLERSTVLLRDPTNAGRRFVPLLLADCTLPDTLRRYKYVDFRQDTAAAFEELLTACRREAEATRPGATPTTENTARPPEQAEQAQPIALLGGKPEAPGDGVSGAAVSLEVKDSAHRKLLEDPEVMAVDIEEFKATIVERVRKVLKPQAPNKKEVIGRDFLVFVNAAEDDLQLATSVSQELDRRSIGYVLPLPQGQPSEIRQDLEQNLRECDGVILIFGRTGLLWVKSQLLQARKIISQRDSPLHIIAVYEGPPPKAGNDLGIKLPRVPLRIMRCYSGPDELELNGFVDALRAGWPA